MFDQERAIREWRDRIADACGHDSQAVEELESHLREELQNLADTRLSPEEILRVARRRLGDPDELRTEFVKVEPSRRWSVPLFWIGIGFFAVLVGHNVLSAVVRLTAIGGARLGVDAAVPIVGLSALLAVGLCWLIVGGNQQQLISLTRRLARPAVLLVAYPLSYLLDLATLTIAASSLPIEQLGRAAVAQNMSELGLTLMLTLMMGLAMIRVRQSVPIRVY